MIDREKIGKFLDIMEYLLEEDATLSIRQDGKLTLNVYPKNWWSGNFWDENKRHKMLGLITPLVGKLEKQIDGRNIGYSGESEGISIRLSYIDKCKIVGYKTVKKTVREEIEREPEYEEKEVEEQVAITDCEIRQGKYSEDDIEVPA